MMERRDNAKPGTYRQLRNRVSALVRRDRLRTNLAKLDKAKGDPKALWRLANEALGKPASASLPSSLVVNGADTAGDKQAAEAMNDFYIQKVLTLRASIKQDLGDRPSLGQHKNPDENSSLKSGKTKFNFAFASAGRIAKVIKGLGSTEALGVDGIPVSILKKGVGILAAPIARLVNVSLSTGIVPRGFKTAIVVPIHKGKGKKTNDPASYRPVSLLPAMSKILEIIVKEALEKHLAKVNGLPNSQFGFRPGRSSTAAIATAHALWHKAVQTGHTLGIMGFDLSAAFDTIDPSLLVPKLAGLGITGTELDWFANYLVDGRQMVNWSGTLSGFNTVKFGVRQGSILGPILFLILMADLPKVMDLCESGLVGYADDVAIWVSHKDPLMVQGHLTKHAANFAKFAAERGLVLNAGKTQLMWAGGKTNSPLTLILQPWWVLSGPVPLWLPGWQTTFLEEDTCHSLPRGLY